MDAEGYITIVDRLKNMINISGLKVFPNEVEKVLTQHPKVLEVAVIGVENSRGEMVKAFMVKRDASLTTDELKNHFKFYLTRYKRPSLYEFMEEFHKSNVGKALHRVLK